MAGLARRLGRGRGRLVAAGVAVLLVVVAGGFVRLQDSTDVVAYFSNTDGIYAGDEVRIQGVPVGRIDKIEPDGTRMRVEFHLDDDIAVPADAQAVIVAPSLVSSRYIQLAPRFEGGERMADGAVIPLERTSTPVEWDEIKGQVYDLSEALGPRGANKDGAISDVATSLAGALAGRGKTINQTIGDLSKAMRVLDEGADDAFSTVRNLQVFVSALAASDRQVELFIERLDGVAAMFASDRRLLRAALKDLSTAVEDVSAFVEENGDLTTQTIRRLGRTTQIVAKQEASLAQILHAGPLALENLTRIYREKQNAVSVNMAGANVNSPGKLLCGAVGGAAGTTGEDTEKLCSDLVGDLLDGLGGSREAQDLLATLLLLTSGGGS